MAFVDTHNKNPGITTPLNKKPSPKFQMNLGTRITLSISLAIGLVSIIIFFWIYALQQRQVMSQVETEAKSLITSMVLMREWVANYGGVWTDTPGDIYMEEKNGFYRKTPAMVTKEMSYLSDKKNFHRFHITSNNLTNPDNAPFPSEKSMLENFAQGHPVFGQIEELDGERVYHYMAPLTVEGPCLECHQQQGYKIGDLRGGLSIFLPMDKVDNALAQNRWTLTFSATTIILLLISLYLLVRRLIVGPIGQLKSVTMAVGEGNYDTRCHLNTGDELESLGTAINYMIDRLKTSREHLENKVQQRTNELTALSEITFSISRTQTLTESLNEALEALFKVTVAESGTIHILEENSPAMTLIAWRGLPNSIENCLKYLGTGECIPGQAVKNESSVCYLNSEICHRNNVCKENCPLGDTNWSLISAPLKSKEQVMGVITLITRQPQGFSDENSQLLEYAGHQLGVAVENAHLHKQAGQIAILEERNRLARELHDNVGQTIGYINFNTRIIKGMLESGQHEEAQNLLKDMGDSTKKAYDDVRWAIFDLHTPGDDNQSFKSSLETYLDEFEVQTGLNCHLSIAKKDQLSPDVRVQTIRIIQEAMHNVRKHAQATDVWISFKGKKSTPHLTVEDNGIGIDNSKPDPLNRHFGLQTMRERAESIGCQFNIESREEGGTRVSISQKAG